MNDILFTGNIKNITNAMLENIDKNSKVILCGETAIEKFKNSKVKVYSYRENDNEYRGVFKSYDFNTVVYFSKVMDGKKRLYDELENLENALYSASLSGIENFVYVTTNDYIDGKNSTRTKLLKTCEDICKHFVDENNLSVLILRVPYVYSLEDSDCHLLSRIKSAKETGEVILDGDKDTVTDFLNDQDFGRLLARIHNEPMTGFHIVDVVGKNKMTFREVGHLIQEYSNAEKILYKGYDEAIPKVGSDNLPEHIYGWKPSHKLADDMPLILQNIKQNEKAVRRRNWRIDLSEKASHMILVGGELILLFLLAEFLTDWTIDNYRMDYVDFRLLFVVIMGIMHGTLPGIMASVFACVGYFAEDFAISNLQIIFFNIENWLPFAAYFLSGTIMGHAKDKYEETYSFMKQQYDILEGKYLFLNDLYGKTLENKEEFSRQLIGYENSFGKIYQMIKKLNSTMTDKIFYESVFSIEELLNTRSVAIYTLGDNSSFARLNVCSRDMVKKLSKSLDMSKFPILENELNENRIFYNAKGLEGYPAYVSPVWKDDKLYGAIFLWEASASQMKMDFYNRFSILCGLVQDAMVRAIQHEEQQMSIKMVENTKILKAVYFEEIVAMKEKMGKEGLTDYMLLEVDAPQYSLKELGEQVTSGIRSSDMLGMRNDEKVYLLLNQTKEASLEIVRKRMEPKGIKLIRK